MPLDKATLTATLTAIFADLTEKTAAQKAGEIADAIDVYVRTATVTTVVAVTSVGGVTPGPGVSGPGAGTGSGGLS